MSREFFGRGLAAAVSILALVVVAPAAANHVRCGDVITEDTTLDSDLDCAGDALTIGAGDVTVDLDGHTIQGSGVASGVRSFAGHDTTGPTVRGGTIRGFSVAIEVDGPTGTMVEGMVLEQNGTGVECSYAPGCSVLDSVLRDNVAAIILRAADSGHTELSLVRRNRVERNTIGIRLADNPTLVTQNRITSNRGDGVVANYITDVDVERNLIARNGGDGVVVEFLSRATVSSNRIERNDGNGVRLSGDFFFGNTDAHIRGNRITRNGRDGVLVEPGGSHAIVEHNRTDRNGDDGIDVEPEAPGSPFEVDAVLRANRAFFNADLGIEAAAGTTDGGGNRAGRNGNPAQCVGVRCR